MTAATIVTVKQDRQWTYDVTLRRVRATIVAVEKQLSVTQPECVFCSLRHPACSAHEPHHLWPAWLYNIFPNCLKNGTIFNKKKFTEHNMCVSIFSATFIWNISHFSKN